MVNRNRHKSRLEECGREREREREREGGGEGKIKGGGKMSNWKRKRKGVDGK